MNGWKHEARIDVLCPKFFEGTASYW